MNATTNQYCIKCHKYWGSEASKWYCSSCFKEEQKNLKLEPEIKQANQIETEKMDVDIQPEKPKELEIPVIERPVQVNLFLI
jgi:hypothetical protein